MSKIFSSIHEFVTVGPQLATVTASIHGGERDPIGRAASLSEAMGNRAHPVRGSFRVLDASNPNVVFGYVFTAAPVHVLQANEEPNPQRFHKMATKANVYMDTEDHSTWELTQSAGGTACLARNGADDLTDVLETARVGARQGIPRMAQIARTTAKVNDLASFVSLGNRFAEVDHGFVVSATDSHFRVMSFAQKSVIEVPQAYLVAQSHVVPATVPVLPSERIQRAIASRAPGSQRTNASIGVLAPEEYWKEVYGYAPDYLAKVLEQVRHMEAL